MASNSELLGCKKRKRPALTSTSTVFRFKSFGENGYPAELNGSFMKNVRALLEAGRMESTTLCNGLLSWSFQLEVHRHRPDRTVFLFIVEEPVEASLYRHCTHCQYIGWGQHMICNMKYHFVVPSKETVATAIAAACVGCQQGKCCHVVALRSDTAAAAAAPKKQTSFNLVELDNHALHGVFHCNGFGHLLRINGVEMGSDLTGHYIMDFWDRLCLGLRARKVSLSDSSCKRGMELRLIHGVAYAGPWFQRWGYQFSRGSFGVTLQMYQKAIQALQNIPLCLLLPHLNHSHHNIALIFTRYQALSNHSLITLGDLFQFMLELNSRLPRDPPGDSNGMRAPPETSHCRWSPKRVEMATRAIVDALRRSEFKWVSRQEVRDTARNYIGDTGLLDFVLKSLGNHVVGNYLVRRSLNPVTKVLEYSLEDISGALMNGQMGEKPRESCRVSRSQLTKDMLYLYKCLFKERKLSSSNNGLLSAIPIATSIILDTKFFIKEFCSQIVVPNDSIEVDCRLEMKNNQERKVPSEVLIVKANMSTEGLKREAENRFRELYWGMKGLRIEAISNLNPPLIGWDGETVSRLVTESGNVIFLEGMMDEAELQGICQSSNGDFRYVECICGAEEDDGERMVVCDICEVWQHTRCLRIPNTEDVPKIFICNRCEQEIVFPPALL
ncbi:hypothetical protein V2J09_000684 [Rumex salicifolius]